MAKEKQIAHGTVVTQAGSAINLITAIDPPPRKRELIDARDMSTTMDVPLLGIEERSEFSLEEHWHPGEASDEALDALFDSKAEITVELVTPHDVPVTDSIPAKVIGLEPQQLTPQGLYKRKVNFLRTGDITRTGGGGSSSSSPGP